MNRLQRKIKKLNESVKILMYEAKDVDLIKRLQGLMTQYIAFLNGSTGKNINAAEFQKNWYLALRPGSEGYKRNDGSVVTTIDELRVYLMGVIISACNSFKTGALVVKGKQLNSADIYNLFLSDKRLGLEKTLLFALQQLQVQNIILKNEKLNYEQAIKVATKNPLQFSSNMLVSSV